MALRRPTLVLPVSLALILGACSSTSADPEVTGAPVLPTVADALPATSVAQFERLLGQLEGTPVVVNVWASWCGPCETETPRLVEASRDHPAVQFLGVDTQDSREGAEGFIAKYGVPYPSVFNPDGSIMTSLNGSGPPITVFYRADGSIEATVPGELSQGALNEHLAAIGP